jgi:hypothetical protein
VPTILRGSCDFEDLAAYRRFIDKIVGRNNLEAIEGLADRQDRFFKMAFEAATLPLWRSRFSEPSGSP